MKALQSKQVEDDQSLECLPGLAAVGDNFLNIDTDICLWQAAEGQQPGQPEQTAKNGCSLGGLLGLADIKGGRLLQQH